MFVKINGGLRISPHNFSTKFIMFSFWGLMCRRKRANRSFWTFPLKNNKLCVRFQIACSTPTTPITRMVWFRILFHSLPSDAALHFSLWVMAEFPRVEIFEGIYEHFLSVWIRSILFLIFSILGSFFCLMGS